MKKEVNKNYDDIDSIEYKNRLWYLRTYESLISKALSRGLNRKLIPYYTEKHHILPKCLGGTNIKSNLCLLTAREHILAHMLLSCMYPNNFRLALAVSRMFVTKEPDRSNKDYETIKSRYDVTTKISTRLLADFREKSVEAIRQANKGRKKSKETLEKLSNSMKEFNKKNPNYQKGKKVHTDKHRKELSEKWKGSKNPNFGGITEEHRRNLSLAHFGTSPNQKKVVDNNSGKIYRSIADAARAANVPESTLKYWIKNRPDKGYRIIS